MQFFISPVRLQRRVDVPYREAERTGIGIAGEYDSMPRGVYLAAHLKANPEQRDRFGKALIGSVEQLALVRLVGAPHREIIRPDFRDAACGVLHFGLDLEREPVAILARPERVGRVGNWHLYC